MSVVVQAPDVPIETGGAMNLGDERGPVMLSEMGNGAVVTTMVVNDVAGRPTVMVQCFGRRLVAEQAALAVRHVGLALAAAGGICTLLTLGLLGRLVLGRLGRLSRDLEGISTGTRRRVDVRGNDELGRVAEAVNRTLERWTTARGAGRERGEVPQHGGLFATGIFLCGPLGETMYRNPACELVLGQTTEEGRNFGWWSGVHAGDREKALREWHRNVAGGLRWHQQYRVVTTSRCAGWTATVPRLFRRGRSPGTSGRSRTSPTA